jgi:hypothetical protein
MRIELMTTWHQLYLIPTIKVTHDRMLFGYYNVEFWWFKWGIEISFGEKE